MGNTWAVQIKDYQIQMAPTPESEKATKVLATDIENFIASEAPSNASVQGVVPILGIVTVNCDDAFAAKLHKVPGAGKIYKSSARELQAHGSVEPAHGGRGL